VKGIALGLIACVLVAISCGPIQYSHHILAATEAVSEAETAGGDTQAPYELTYAKEHLDQARREVGYSDFDEAIKCARIATEYAEKARDISNRNRREQGR